LQRWYTRYNLKAKRTGQIRLLIVRLPSRSPWLNPIEPVFGQAKRRLVGRRLVPQPNRLKQKTERYFNRREKRLGREEAQTVANT
jgi:transposase